MFFKQKQMIGNHLIVRSEERREGKSVDLGGRRIIKKKTHNDYTSE